MFNVNHWLDGNKIAYIHCCYAHKVGSRGNKDVFPVYIEYKVVEYRFDESKVLHNKQFIVCPPFEITKAENGWSDVGLTYSKIKNQGEFFCLVATDMNYDLEGCILCGNNLDHDVCYPLRKAYQTENRGAFSIAGKLDVSRIRMVARGLHFRGHQFLRTTYNDVFPYSFNARKLELKGEPDIHTTLYRELFEKQLERFNDGVRKPRELSWFLTVSNNEKYLIDPDGLFTFSLGKEPVMKVGRYAGTKMKDIPPEYWDIIDRPTLQNETLEIIRMAKNGIFPSYRDFKGSF